MSDLAYAGKRLTWSNNQVGDSRVERKIDRALVNEKWGSSFGFSKAYFDVPFISDHSPATVSVSEMQRPKGFPFRYKNFWGKEKAFKDLVLGSWRHYVRGTRQFILQQKLSRMKQVFIKWDKENFANLKESIECDTRRLGEAQAEQQVQGGQRIFRGRLRLLRRLLWPNSKR